MPYPIDSSLFDGKWIEERAARAATNPRPIVRALFVGGDFPRKGGIGLLKAWRSSNLGSRAALDIVTDWALEPEDLPPSVRLIRGVSPYTASWRELWRQADFFVMPTKQEAFGMVYQEAAAAGLPVSRPTSMRFPRSSKTALPGFSVQTRATFQPWSVPCGRLSNPQSFGTGWDSPPTNGLQRSPIRAPIP